MLTDVFVPLFSYPEETPAETLPHLAKLLEAFASSVTYCGIEIDVPDVADRWGAQLAALPQMAAEVERKSREGAARLLGSATSIAAGFDAHTSTLRAPFMSTGIAVARQARNYDITAAAVRAGSADGRAISEHILFGSGRPLLLAPMEATLPTSLSRVAIAWDGGSTAYRGVYDAMPLLVRAESVVVLTAPGDKEIASASTDALVRYLQRHCVEPRLAEADPSKKGVAHDLQTAALSQQADVLVMGAYGHSRLREFILGGATSGVLNQTIMPVFMSR